MLTDLERQILHLLNDISHRLEAERVESIEGLITHGEPVVAVEIICDNLADENEELPYSIYERIRELVEGMEIDEKYISQLRHDSAEK